jgi:hypothetical protein
MGGVKQMRFDKSGNLVAVIEAERAEPDEEGMLLMEQIQATVNTDSGDQVEIRASKGRVNTEGTGDAFFEEDIVVGSPDFVARTSRATWRESDNTVRGDDRIVLEGQGLRIAGSGFVVFAAENKAVIYKPRGTVRPVKRKAESEAKKVEDGRPLPRENAEERSPSSLDE